jgi:AraC-like DNA-binding protein
MTFKDYLTELRMTKAKGLMEDESSVAQAAQECGYDSESNFIAVYRRRWGCTPAQTKKQETE